MSSDFLHEYPGEWNGEVLKGEMVDGTVAGGGKKQGYGAGVFDFYGNQEAQGQVVGANPEEDDDNTDFSKKRKKKPNAAARGGPTKHQDQDGMAFGKKGKDDQVPVARQVPEDYDPFGVGKAKKKRKKYKGMTYNVSGENWDFAKINKQRVEEEQKNAYEMAKTPARNIHKANGLAYEPEVGANHTGHKLLEEQKDEEDYDQWIKAEKMRKAKANTRLESQRGTKFNDDPLEGLADVLSDQGDDAHNNGLGSSLADDPQFMKKKKSHGARIIVQE